MGKTQYGDIFTNFPTISYVKLVASAEPVTWFVPCIWDLKIRLKKIQFGKYS